MEYVCLSIIQQNAVVVQYKIAVQVKGCVCLNAVRHSVSARRKLHWRKQQRNGTFANREMATFLNIIMIACCKFYVFQSNLCSKSDWEIAGVITYVCTYHKWDPYSDTGVNK